MPAAAQPAGVPPAGRFALTAALFSSIGQTFFIGLFGADFRAAFALSDAAFGTLYSVATLASGILMFWLGGLADHLALRRAVVAVLALMALGAAGVALAPSAWLLLPALFVLRLTGQGLMGHLGVVAAGRFAVRRRGRAVAMVSYGFILGEACLPPLVALALAQYDWRAVWLTASLFVAAIGMPLLYWLARPLKGNPAAAGEAATVPADGAPLQGRARLLGNGLFLRALAVVLGPPVLVTALFLHQGALAERLEWSRIAVGQAFVLFALAQAAAAFAAGRLIDRFSARALLRFELLPGAFAVLALGFGPPAVSLWLMFAGLGILSGLNSVISGAIWIELFGTRQLGMIRGVYAALMVVSTAAGPILLGALLDGGVSLRAIATAVAVYAVVVPLLVTPRIASRRTAGESGRE